MMEDNCLKKYIDEMLEGNLSRFSLISRVPLSTVRRITLGQNRPSYATARKIAVATKKELTLEHFGFAKGSRKRVPSSDHTREADIVAASSGDEV